MDEKLTVSQMYKDTKLPILRFYLASIEQSEAIQIAIIKEDQDTDSLPNVHNPTKL
jgi:hypothetical protein